MPKLFHYFVVLIQLFIGITAADLYAQLPPDFIETCILDELDRPTGITFDESGQAYIWEKSGRIHSLDSNEQLNPLPLLDIREEVGDWGDHGLLGFTLDPDFLDNGYCYTMYVVDRHHLLHAGTSTYSADSNLYYQATIGRIVRYQADPTTDFTTIIEGSRKILVGETLDEGIPILVGSHGVGSLFFGTDGTLLASTGESGSFTSNDMGSDPVTYFQQALDDGIIQAHENVGAFRSQMIESLNGKILRIDPQTGNGVYSNPYYDSDHPRSARSRVYALGLRNPFRCILRPGSGSHNPADGDPGAIYIGDVGGNQWEELNICTHAGMNFGWPLYEGVFPKNIFYNASVPHPLAPNPCFENASCDQEFYTFQELLQQPREDLLNIFENTCDSNLSIDSILTYMHALPTISYPNQVDNLPARTLIPTFDENGQVDTFDISNTQSTLESPAIKGIAGMAGVFYEGDNFPEAYQGQYFHADYSGWIKSLEFNEPNDLQQIENFLSTDEKITSLAVHPINGCLYYTNLHSKLLKLCYGGNNPPLALAHLDRDFGPSPLSVQFTGEASYDPDGTALNFLWNFGDGTTSEASNPTHIFTSNNEQPKKYEVELTVTDSLGASDAKELIVSVNNTPPQVEISSFEDGDSYSVGGYSILPLSALVTDAEQASSDLQYRWTIVLKHNMHEHSDPPIEQADAFATIEPLGCSPEEIYWYQIQLEVEDDFGLIGRDTNEIFPFCEEPFFELANWAGKVKKDAIHLDWLARFEEDVDHYLVQRITNEYGLQTLAKVEAMGAGLNYSFLDKAPVYGSNNYRLKVYRSDGTYDFSTLIRLTFPPTPAVKVYPNPSSNVCTFELAEPTDNLQIEIYDYKGSLVISQKHSAGFFEVSLKNLPVGTYTYLIKTNGNAQTGKLVRMP